MMNPVLPDKRKNYLGAYNKETGEVVVSGSPEGITDDINHFIPFQPLFAASDGTVVSLITADQIHEWFEKNKTDNPALLALKNIGEEDNPVVVICK